MNDAQNMEIMNLLLQIQRDLGALRQDQASLAQQLTALDQRMTQVEYCVTNHYNDFRQTGNRTIWTNEQRTAFGDWLVSNTLENDIIPLIQPPSIDD